MIALDIKLHYTHTSRFKCCFCFLWWFKPCEFSTIGRVGEHYEQGNNWHNTHSCHSEVTSWNCPEKIIFRTIIRSKFFESKHKYIDKNLELLANCITDLNFVVCQPLSWLDFIDKFRSIYRLFYVMNVASNWIEPIKFKFTKYKVYWQLVLKIMIKDFLCYKFYYFL